MKLLLIGYFHGFGGAEKQLILLANEMKKRKHEVILLSLVAHDICYPLNNGVQHIKIIEENKHVIINRFINLRKTIQKIRPDVVINFWFQSAYFTALMHKSIRGKVVYCERGDPSDCEYSGILGLIRKITLPWMDYFVFQTKGAQSCFSLKVQEKSAVIHNSVNIKKDILNNNNFNKNKSRKRIVNIGRLSEQKNQLLLINSFQLFQKKYPDYNLEIYGDGELYNVLNNRIIELDLSEKVFLMGTYSNLYEKIIDADFFVLTSDYEGMPNALIEAMALGLPSISTDCKPGGARELIKDGINGLLVPRKNKEKLVDAMCHFAKNNELRLGCGRNGEQIVFLHLGEVIYKQWEDVFKGLVK